LSATFPEKTRWISSLFEKVSLIVGECVGVLVFWFGGIVTRYYLVRVVMPQRTML
jgi:hypothetical protein